MSSELEERIEEESRAQWNKSNEEIKNSFAGATDDSEENISDSDDNMPPVDFE